MKAAAPPCTVEELRYWLEYREGCVYWRRSRTGTRGRGQRAGCDDPYKGHGYRWITIGKMTVGEHRIVWTLVHGRWPTMEIDHINGRRADNRIENLREATRVQNSRNCRKANPTGYTGVYLHGKRYKWQLKGASSSLHLAGYRTAAEAAMAREPIARMMHGEFAVLNFPGFYEREGK